MTDASAPMPAIWSAVRDVPTQWALTDGTTILDWEALTELLARRASALAQLEWGDARRIAVLGENSIDTLLTYAAAALAGVGAVSVNFRLKRGEVAYLVADSSSTVIWCDAERQDTAIAAAEAVGAVRVLVSGGDCAGAQSWDALVAASDVKPPAWDIAPGEALTYTSGTTGYPKGVSRTRQTSATVGEAIQAMGQHYAHGLGPHLVAGPLYHGGPFAGVGLLLNANPVVIPGRFDPEQVLALIDRFRVASSLMVPTHFVRLLSLDASVRKRYDVSSLRVVGQTGAPCPVHVKRQMIEWFGPVFRESYGGTESGILSVINSAEWLEHPGSVGRAIEPFTALVVDEEGREVAGGVQGRLFFRDATGRGIVYHNDPEKSAAAHLEPGVFTLGEIGYVDDEGYIFLTDRATDLVISGGVNIYPAECERVLLAHPDVRDAAVFGVPDAEMGESLLGAVVVRGDVTGDDLVAHCREALAHYKVPRVIHLVEELPRSAMGKLDKRGLRAAFASATVERSGEE